MVINYFEKDNFWPKGITSGFLEELKNSGIVSTNKVLHYREFGSDKEKVLLEVDTYKPDIILLTDDAIADILMTDLMKRNIVTFFTGVNKNESDLEWFKPEWRSLQTGVIQHYRAAESIRLLKKLKPIHSIGILAGPSKAAENLSKFIMKDIIESFPEIKVSIRSEGLYSNWKSALIELNKTNDALWPLLPFHVHHENGELVHWTDVGEFMRTVVTVPTVGVGNLDGSIDRLFSIGINPYKMGQQVGIQAYFYLMGKPIVDIPTERFRFHNFQVKYQEVNRLNLNLPEELFGFARIVEYSHEN
ncbi:MAG: ABC transporter substrate binding protein [Ekhidna sp.]